MGEAEFGCGKLRTCLLAHPDKVFCDLLLGIWDADFWDVVRREHSREERGVSLVVFHAVAEGPEDLGRRTHHALKPGSVEGPRKGKPGGITLVDRPCGTRKQAAQSMTSLGTGSGKVRCASSPVRWSSAQTEMERAWTSSPKPVQ